MPATFIKAGILLFCLSTLLASAQNGVVTHDTWNNGTAMPRASASPTTGVIKGKIYVVGGRDGTTILGNNQIYDPTNDSWSSGAVLPLKTYAAASAVVNGVLYVIGGTNNGTNPRKIVWAYNAESNTWSRKASILTARAGARAVVEKNIIYVIGGVDINLNPLKIVESYDPATDTWTTQAPLLVEKAFASVGLLGSTIVAADGRSNSGDTGDNEGYNPSANAWVSLVSDPTGRDLACGGAISGRLYVAGGRIYGGGPGTPALDLTESFDVSKESWTTLSAMPQATQDSGSATYNGRLYCFGGQTVQAGAAINDVQIYQP